MIIIVFDTPPQPPVWSRDKSAVMFFFVLGVISIFRFFVLGTFLSYKKIVLGKKIVSPGQSLILWTFGLCWVVLDFRFMNYWNSPN